MQYNLNPTSSNRLTLFMKPTDRSFKNIQMDILQAVMGSS